MRELQILQKDPPPGISLYKAEELLAFYVDIKVVDSTGQYTNPIYQDEFYRLRFKFPTQYPVEVPEVQFVTSGSLVPIPTHPHIYSNGHICLDVLGSGWTPVQTVASISLSIQSMLMGNNVNSRPPDDDLYTAHAPANPKNSRFVYHDDTV